MKPFIKWVGGLLLVVLSLLHVQAQTDTLCDPNENKKIFGELYFNYGTGTNVYSSLNRSTMLAGQPLVTTSNMLSQKNQGAFGLYSAWLLPPQPPILLATQGDFKDRIKLSWNMNALSPEPTGFVIYRDGSFLTELGDDVRQYLDFNTQAGEYYEYTIEAKNSFGTGSPSKAVGFVNPNGVVTGKIESNSGNPVPNVEVRLTPLTGNSMAFDGVNDELCVSYNDKFPTDKFTVSAYVKLGNVNNEGAIIDWGSKLNKNWWITTTASAEGKGYIFHIGNGTGSDSLKYILPNPITNLNNVNDWHQITMVFNGSSMSVMVDGIFVGTKPANIMREKNYLNIGSKIGNDGFFKGKLDDIRIYNRPLTQTEINNTKNRSVSKTESGLVSYWKMDEGVGIKVFDNTTIPTVANIFGATFSNDKPEVYSSGITDVTGYYVIDGINYSQTEGFRATPMKNFEFNSAVEFNAADKSYGNLTDFDMPDTSTVEVLFHPFDLKSRQTVLSKGSLYEAYIDNGKLFLNLNGTITDLGAVRAKYYHLAVSLDNSAGNAKVYLEGELSATVSFAGASNWQNGSPWLLATNSTNAATGKFYTGLVDDFLIYKTALPQHVIQEHFVVGIPEDSTTAMLYSHFDLNEATDNKVYDYGIVNFGGQNPREGTLTKANWSNNARRKATKPHEFEPNVRVVNVNLSNTAVGNVDFKDVSTVNVSGYVRFANTFCFEEQIEILVNGQSYFPQIFTDRDGKWTADFEPGKTIKLSATYKDHLFGPSFFEIRKLQAPKAGIVFLDNTKRFVKGQITGGECRKSILPIALDPTSYQVLKIESTNGCFSKIDTLRNPDGNYVFDNLPAIAFETKYLFHSYNNSIKIFFNNKGGQQSDLRDAKGDTLDFIYRAAPTVMIDTSKIPLDKCNNLILQQSMAYPDSTNPTKYLNLKFKTFEIYYGGSCVLDSVKYIINNDIGDRQQEQITSNTDELVYKSYVGVPNILAPYTKKLQVVADYKGNLASKSVDVRVFGMLSRPSTFTTAASPQLDLILRDPPGDASTATLEAGTTNCQKVDRSWLNTVGLEVSKEFTIGKIVKTVVGTLPGTATIVEKGIENKLTITANAGYTNQGSKTTNFCITKTKTISTSSIYPYIGRDGDIFSGSGMNYTIGLNDRISLGSDSCSVKADSLVYLNPKGFHTEYTYTRKFINEDVIPSLQLIVNSATDSDSAKVKAKNALFEWRKVMLLDSLLLVNSNENTQNISFDAGVSYSKSIKTESVEDNSKVHTLNVGGSIGVQFKFETFFPTLSTSLKANYSHTENWGNSNSKTEPVTFSYIFADSNPGDNFSVDISEFKKIPDYVNDSLYNIKREREAKFASIKYPDQLWTPSQVDSLNAKQNELIAKAAIASANTEGGSNEFFNNFYDPSKPLNIWPLTPFEIFEYRYLGIRKGNFPAHTIASEYRAIVRKNGTLNLPMWVSPAFKLVAGESMCPWEGTVTKNPNTGVETFTGTLNREEVFLSTDKNVATNVPANTPAVYHLKVGNMASAIRANTALPLTFKLIVVPGSNPRGAEVKVNGQNISLPIPFVLNQKEVLDVTLTIDKGPIDYDYSGIKVAFYSECEMPSGGIPSMNTVNDTHKWFYREVVLDAHFIEPCSPVDIAYPLQNFVQTPGDLNKQSISLIEYNKNDPDLVDIRVQYRRVDGDGAWINIQRFLPEELADLQTNLLWSTELLRDDSYEIRAITSCRNIALAPGISTVIRGKLERIPPVVFGVPEPSDGTWDPGDEISITFNEPINCDKIVQADILSNNTIGLYDATTNALVDATITCVGSKLIIVPNINPVFFENRVFRVVVSGKDYDDAKLLDNPNHQAAAIRDKAGNMIPKTIKWEFAVNQNSLEWIGNDVIEVNEVLKPFSVKRQVRNRGGSIASFRMENVPSWLTVSPSTGTLNPGQTAEITLTFQQDLLIGDYAATLNMTGSKGKEPLGIDYRVRCPQPNYEVVDPTQYESSMNIVARLSIFDKFSADPSDVIVAKIDGQIRGVGKVNYYRNIPAADATIDGTTFKPKDESNRWLVFMTIFGDETDNDKPIAFSVWDGDKCNEYVEVINRINFQTGALVGSPIVPDTIKVINVVRKCIPLNRGWNWVSFNLDLPEGNTVTNVLASLQLKSGAIIKSEDLSAKYYANPINGWLGSLTAITPESRYMINVSQRDTVCIKGRPYLNEDFPITINPGWNWVGYVPSTGMTVTQALRGLTPLNGDLIKSQTLFAQYVAGVGWIGNLNFLEPLKGYLLKISNGGTLIYPTNLQYLPGSVEGEISEEALIAQVAQEAPMTFDFTKYQLTMNLIGKVNGIAIDADDELRAYINGELVGINKSISHTDNRLFFQTIYFDDETNISFKLYKADRKKEYELNRTIPFKSETLAGLVEDPIIFELETANLVPITIDIKDQLIWQPNQIFPTVSIPNAVSGQSTACGSFTFNSVLPVSTETKPLCVAQTGLSDNMTGVMKINYNERSTFVSNNDVLSFINPATNQTVGCGTFDNQYRLFNINIKGGLTETPIDVVYYSDVMKKTFKVKSGVMYRSNRELGDYLNPAPMDVSPLSITNNNGVITAVLRDTSWTGKYCIDAFALNCPNFGDGQTTFCFLRFKQGACLDIVVRNITESTNNVVKAVSISSQVIVNSGIRLEYKGGNKIELKPGFETKSGTVFTGKIEGCSN